MNQLPTEEVIEQTSTLADLIGIDIGGIILKILWALIIVFVFIMIGKLLANVVRRNIINHSSLENKEHSFRVANLMRDITFYIMVIFAFFIGFEMVGFNVGLILWWISFWVWLAFKEILGNMIAGMMILYTKELKLGDVIEVEADKTYFGRIEQITIRYTTIRTLDLRQVILPNMTLISAPIKTFSAEDIVKLTTDIGVHYDCDIDKAIQVVKDTINQFEFIREKQSTKIYVTAFEDSEIVLKCIFFFDPNAWLLADYVIGHVHEAVIKAFAANDLQMAYPHVTLTFDDPVYQKSVQELLDKNKSTQVKF
jgi:small conductance mechanosensitive channel